MTAESVNPAADSEATAKRALVLAMSGHALYLVGALTAFRVPFWLTLGLFVAGLALSMGKPRPVPAKLTWWEQLIHIGGSVVILFAIWLAGNEASMRWPLSAPGLALGWLALCNGYRDFCDRRNALHPPTGTAPVSLDGGASGMGS